MSKIFVIAGNKVQADVWIKKDIEKRISRGETTMSLSQYVFVGDATRLRGVSNPHGVFVGTWKERWDIREVVETLMVQSDLPIPKLREIWGEVKDRVKPTPKQPKLHPVSGGYSIAVDEAAGLLAQEIDRQVLQQVSQQTISYDQMLPSMIQAIQELNKRTKELEDARSMVKP